MCVKSNTRLNTSHINIRMLSGMDTYNILYQRISATFGNGKNTPSVQIMLCDF